MTAALFRKDLRLFRPVVWGAIGVGVVFWFVVPLCRLAAWWFTLQPRNPLATRSGFTELSPGEKFAQFVADGSELMLPVLLVVAATIGGMALAAERRARSIEWLAMLPVPRWRWVGSKLVAAVVLLGLMFVANLSVLASADVGQRGYVTRRLYADTGPLGELARTGMIYAIVFLLVSLFFRRLRPWVRWSLSFVVCVALCATVLVVSNAVFWLALQPNRYGWWYSVSWYVSYLQVFRIVTTILPAALALFGLAWLLSSLVRSSVFAAAAAVAITVAVVFPVYTLTYAVEYSRELQTRMLMNLVIGEVTAGLVAVLVGSVIQLRRQSP